MGKTVSQTHWASLVAGLHMRTQAKEVHLQGSRVRENGYVTPKKLSSILKNAQVAHLDDTLCDKTIHGVFFKQAKQEAWDT